MARNVHIGKTSDGHGYFIAGGARITLYEDYLEWDGGLMNRECANIYYSDIISVTYTNGDFFVNASFQISTAGKNYTIRMTCAYANLEVIANAIERERAKEKNKQSRKAVGSSISVSDEIIKFSQLKEQGIISQQEFEEAKKQLLATGINPNAPVVKKQEPENVSDYHYVEEERVLNIMTKLPENQYTSGSPILILSGTLLKETPTSNILLQLVFQNLSYKDIVGVKITVQARDTFGEPLEGYSGFQYVDFSAKHNETFGQKESIKLPDKNTRKCSVIITEVVYSDGEYWKNDAVAICRPIPKQKSLEEKLKENGLVEQYKRDTTPYAKYCPTTHADLWLCTCGTANKRELGACRKCKVELSTLVAAANLDKLEHRKQEYDRKLRANARKKRKVAITVISILAILALIITGVNILKSKKQNEISEMLTPYKNSAFIQYKDMISSATNLKEGNGIAYDVEYETQEINGDSYKITGTYSCFYGNQYSHHPFTITGILGEETMQLKLGNSYVTDWNGNRIQ